MRINLSGGTPLYTQIADQLRTDILGGFYKPGDLLPVEPAMMATFQVGREPIRKALAVLRSEGLVDTKAGRGTAVRAVEQRIQVPVEPGTTVTARMPRGSERHTYRVGEGVPLLEVRGPDGSLDAYPADRVELVFEKVASPGDRQIVAHR